MIPRQYDAIAKRFRISMPGRTPNHFGFCDECKGERYLYYIAENTYVCRPCAVNVIAKNRKKL